MARLAIPFLLNNTASQSLSVQICRVGILHLRLVLSQEEKFLVVVMLLQKIFVVWSCAHLARNHIGNVYMYDGFETRALIA